MASAAQVSSIDLTADAPSANVEELGGLEDARKKWKWAGEKEGRKEKRGREAGDGGESIKKKKMAMGKQEKESEMQRRGG